MIYHDLCGNQVSALGMGIMRLPCIGQGDAHIDEEKATAIFDYAHEHGVNYFDTSYFYHSGNAEAFAHKTLKRYPEGSWFYATKMPWSEADGSTINAQKVFDYQLELSGRDYFDYYLIQNVHDTSIKTYMDRSNGIVDTILEQKRKGRIRHLGFSAHATPENLERFMNFVGDDIDFIQLQVNYLDWKLQKAEEKYKMVTEAGFPIVVMEPLRGGRLANVQQEGARELMAQVAPDMTPAEISFRWLQSLDNVRVILSGFGSMEAVEEDVSIFEEEKPLDQAVIDALPEIREKLVAMTPCTECRYCMRVCPQGLEIPRLIRLRDDCKFRTSLIAAMGVDAIPPEKRADHCIQCGTCTTACPQGIDIPEIMADMVEIMKKLPDPNKH